MWKSLTARILEDTSTSGRKFAALDGLRGLAVITVFLSHSSGFRQRLTPWTSFHGCGHLGVYLFFVLSGFLLAWSLLESGRIRFVGFYLRRFFRIAPLYFLVVTGVFAIQRLTGQVDLYNLHVKGGWPGYLQHLLFYRGDSVFWTIAAEFEFYLILPVLVWLLMRWRHVAATFLAVAALLYGGWYLLIQFGGIDSRYALKIARIVHHSQYFDVFLFGILAAWIYRLPRFAAWSETRGQLLDRTAVIVAAVVAIASVVCIAEHVLVLNREWFPLRHFSILYGIAFAWLVLAAPNGAGLWRRLLDAPLLRVIGVTGFSWYLLHFPILRAVNALYHHDPTAGAAIPWSAIEPLKWATSFVLTGIVAACSYLWIEKPFMVASKSLVQRRRPAPTAVLA